MPLSIDRPLSAPGHLKCEGYPQSPSGNGQPGRIQRPVGVTDTPEQLGVAHMTGGDVIQPLARPDKMFLYQSELFRLRDEAASQVDDLPLVGTRISRRRNAGVTATSGSG